MAASISSHNFLATSIGQVPVIQRRITPKCKLLEKVENIINGPNYQIFQVRAASVASGTALCDVIIPATNPYTNQFLERVYKWAREFFLKNHSFTSGLTIPQVDKISVKLRAFCFEKLKCLRIEIPDEFTKEDLKLLDMKVEEVKSWRFSTPSFAPKKLACHHYALLKANDKGVLEYIFAVFEDDKLKFFEYLQRWGYRTVTELVKGDLVCYLNNGCLMHTGIYRGDNMVESKIGSQATEAYLHPLHLGWNVDGTQLVYFRKTHIGVYKSKAEVLHEVFIRSLATGGRDLKR